MRNFQILLFLLLTLILFSCTSSVEEQPIQVDEQIEELAAEVSLNMDSVIVAIDQQRALIEANLEAPLEVSTDELKAKIKQKWKAIHFYASNGQVVRVKTYPYTEISARTEEFYLENGALILAVIEDNGAGEKGKSSEEIDKMYYFHNEEIVKEFHSTNEKEYSVKESDAEELLVELNEYLDIYNAQKAQ